MNLKLTYYFAAESTPNKLKCSSSKSNMKSSATIIHIINADKMQLQLPQSKIMEDHLVVHIVDYMDRMSSIRTPRNENCAKGPTAAQGLSTPILHLASNGHSSTMDLKLNNDN